MMRTLVSSDLWTCVPPLWSVAESRVLIDVSAGAPPEHMLSVTCIDSPSTLAIALYAPKPGGLLFQVFLFLWGWSHEHAMPWSFHVAFMI